LIYRYTVYTPQEQMKHILFDDKEERLDTLRKIFGIDKYRRITENAQIVLKSLNEKSKEIIGAISDIEEKQKVKKENEDKLNMLRKRISEIRPVLDEIKKKTDLLRAEYEKYSVGFDELKMLKKEIELNKKMLEYKESEIEKKNSEVEEIKSKIISLKEKMLSLEAIKESYQEIESRRRKREAELRSIMERRAALQEEIKGNNKRLSGIKQEIESFSEQRKRLLEESKKLSAVEEICKAKKEAIEKEELLRKEILKKKNEIEVLEHIVCTSKDIIEKIPTLDRCPLCKQVVSESYKQEIKERESKTISEKSSRIELLKKEVLEKEDLLSSLNKEIEDLIQKEKGIEAIKANLKNAEELGKIIEEKQKEYNILYNANIGKINLLKEEEGKDVSMLSKSIEEDNEKLKKAAEKEHVAEMIKENEKTLQKMAVEMERLKKEVTDMRSKKTDLTKRIELLGNVEDKYKEAKKGFEESLSKQNEVEKEIYGIEKESNMMKEIISIIEKEIKQKMKKKEELQEINKIKQWIDNNFTNLMLIIEKHIMTKIYEEFNELFQKWFNVLVEDESLLISLDYDFTPIVQQNGYESSVEHLSGGEKTAVALAYRLSLNRVINDVIGSIRTKDIIILDEPTDGFSSEQLERVRDVIDELNMKQVLIVSHEPKIEGFVDYIIRVEKAGNTSRAFY
ncbi:MAG: SMC family ATPase, partial [Candidatus Woesearchaeota archaeon]|nr:SMC family ATPase [Candidatus Woesearchaeota archaeon]